MGEEASKGECLCVDGITVSNISTKVLQITSDVVIWLELSFARFTLQYLKAASCLNEFFSLGSESSKLME